MLSMLDDEKKMAQTILESPDDNSSSKPPAGGEHELLAGKMIQAFKSGDKKALVSNLKSFVSMCMNDYESVPAEESFEGLEGMH